VDDTVPHIPLVAARSTCFAEPESGTSPLAPARRKWGGMARVVPPDFEFFILGTGHGNDVNPLARVGCSGFGFPNAGLFIEGRLSAEESRSH